jgi:hypothetical protein
LLFNKKQKKNEMNIFIYLFIIIILKTTTIKIILKNGKIFIYF